MIVSLGYEVVNAQRGHARVSASELQVRAARQAMLAAGIRPGDVGAYFTSRPPVENAELQWNMAMIDALKIKPCATTSVTNHGAGHLSALRYATWSVCSGLADYALVTSGSNASLWLEGMQATSVFECDPQFEGCYRPITPSLYGQVAMRYAYEYDITPGQAARISVEYRKWDAMQPLATAYAKPDLTIETELVSRPNA